MHNPNTVFILTIVFKKSKRPKLIPSIPLLKPDMRYRYLTKYLMAALLCWNFISVSAQQADTPTYVVPVVFHIISANPYAIPDSYIINGLKDLNDGFAHAGVYAAGAPGANTGISFCIAHTDPNGGITTGITRTQSVLGNFDRDIEDDKLKNLNDWDPTHYCNIWLVDGVQDENYGGFECNVWIRAFNQSYSTFEGGGIPTDGVVTTGFGAPFIYLVAGYLGLRNTYVYFNCTNNNCETDGDGVCDTPPASQPATSCTVPQNSCPTDTLSSHSNGNFTTDVPDLTSNFMGSATAVRMNLPTARQKK